MEINVLTPSEAFYWAATTALSHGQATAPRGLKTVEVQNFTMNIKYPHILPVAVGGRELRPFIGAVEALQLIGQVTKPELVTDGSKAMANYLDAGLFAGAYGQRAYGQMSRAESLLREDPATRQAVVSIYNGNTDLRATWDGAGQVLDTPCTLTIQFLWSPTGKLNMRVSMRSNDVWLGLPYDLFQFATLQCAMADALNLEPGSYTHTVGSMHAYAKDWDAITELRAPGQPLSHETIYTRRWPLCLDFARISRRARRLLDGKHVMDMTHDEESLATAIQEGIH